MFILSMFQVNLAYENVKEVDGLDISKEGTEMWEAALKRYDERIDRVEVSFGFEESFHVMVSFSKMNLTQMLGFGKVLCLSIVIIFLTVNFFLNFICTNTKFSC